MLSCPVVDVALEGDSTTDGGAMDGLRPFMVFGLELLHGFLV